MLVIFIRDHHNGDARGPLNLRSEVLTVQNSTIEPRGCEFQMLNLEQHLLQTLAKLFMPDDRQRDKSAR